MVLLVHVMNSQSGDGEEDDGSFRKKGTTAISFSLENEGKKEKKLKHLLRSSILSNCSSSAAVVFYRRDGTECEN